MNLLIIGASSDASYITLFDYYMYSVNSSLEYIVYRILYNKKTDKK